MNIPIPKGFNPVRGLIASSVCFLVTLLGSLALSLPVYMFDVWYHDWNMHFDFQYMAKFYGLWLVPVVCFSFFCACIGWLTYSIKTEKPNGFVRSLCQLIITMFAINYLLYVFHLNPIQRYYFKFATSPPLFIRILESTMFPFLATALLTSFMFAKSFWFKDRSSVGATDGPTVSNDEK